MRRTAVLLIAHGTVERLDDLPRFLSNIRRGQPPSEELVREIRRRYEAIGGRSPLLDISHRVAAKVEVALGVPVRLAMRLWEPYPRDVLTALAEEGTRRVVVVPLAQHSAGVYGAAAKEAARDLGLEVVSAPNWGQNGTLLDAYASRIARELAKVAQPSRIVMTAHSLPTFIIKGGDPYEDEVRASAEKIHVRLGPAAPDYVVSFQSQGMSGPGVEWLGPDLSATLEAILDKGVRQAVLAPIGFLADHVEILYDLHIEARAWANERGMVLHVAESLNDSDDLVRAIAEVARPLL